MSRVAKNPITIPSGVEVKINGLLLSVKGSNGVLNLELLDSVAVGQKDGQLTFAASEKGGSWAMAGTTRALVNNMVMGVTSGFEKKLQLIGVGYRAQAKGKVLNLSLGFSHPVDHELPEGITVDTPSQTEIIVKGMDKQLVGQVAANIRAYRPPEPYKGKGVRYVDEYVMRKEAKKK
ncbi:MAG TPA: 50S ribosomal protein L6 [Chromatiaceae bacterium]|jgi:large subunit ribosomal protein L6|nr:50S ribosomal protein L6 [Chromatiaceae bacterium]HIA09030.1 50S ribosomal protein L6 [Chromatiaceae bacterium]HIB85179.1 50S ribosomal protein L6 [Chromatiaceae bacterium]HIN82842.1 50S ribosomal protein L6 [Chromatiales bacterium]HIO54881.1 50S ribosomal protein L6 [Chromatiales bacterium]